MITRKELIKKYIDFFKSKNHKEIPNSSLVPANDPTVLFTTAGMHPLVPFLLGQSHPLGKRLVNVQRCIRTGDIDEVGDESHHTFFEMLGNWSLGDYFKKEAINFSFEFLINVLKIPIKNLAVSVFEGDKEVPKDEESFKTWKSLGIKEERIAFLPRKNNWWGPAGNTGPCGPDTEMFYWVGKSKPKGNPKTNENEWREIWNDVLMQYVKNENGNYVEAKQKNIDTGMGVERTLAILNGFSDNYQTEIWQPIIKQIQELSKKQYKANEKAMRILADHIKASVFIIADGVTPSNTERGYVLRRLIRRAIRYAKELGIKSIVSVAIPIFEIYNDYEILSNKQKILDYLEAEENKFLSTLEQGEKELEKLVKTIKQENKKEIDGKRAFLLYQSFGFPLELIKETASQHNIKINEKEFEQENKKHQELSRTASAGTFKSGLADNTETTKKLHTATHLLNAALKAVLKNKNIHQKGSNITPERLRFDFSFDRKLTSEEIKGIEDLINKKIQDKIPVTKEELPLKKALESGAEAEFGTKYPEMVSVYTINNFSKEICTGPHVSNLSELGKFKIQKEESSSAGVRRIKAVLE